MDARPALVKTYRSERYLMEIREEEIIPHVEPSLKYHSGLRITEPGKEVSVFPFSDQLTTHSASPYHLLNPPPLVQGVQAMGDDLWVSHHSRRNLPLSPVASPWRGFANSSRLRPRFEGIAQSLACPVGDGGAGDVVEGGGVGAVEPAAIGVLDGLERFGFLERVMVKVI